MVKVNIVENGGIMELKYGADLCISQSLKLRELRVSLTKERKTKKEGENTIFDTPWFSIWAMISKGLHMYSGSK